MRLRLAVVIVAVSVIGGGLDAAYAAHFQQDSVQPLRQLAPQPAQQDANTCIKTGDAENFFDFTSTVVKLKSFTFATASSSGSSCPNMSTATQEVIVGIVADDGEQTGAPVTVCLHFDQSLNASASGDFTAQSSVGGLTPPTDPVLVTRNPGALIEFTEGPTNISTGSTQNEANRQFTAAVGDSIDVQMGSESQVSGTTGSASAGSAVNVDLFLGPCTRETPPVSHTGLAALAVALGIGGMALVARRRIRSVAKP